MSRRMMMLCCSTVVALSGWGCSRKGPECRELIGSLNGLGTQLAATQKVTGNEHASPDEIAAALRPFSAAARGVGRALSETKLTQQELRKIAQSAATATTALADASNHLAETAEQLKGLDAAGRAVTEQKVILDSTESDIKKMCDADTSSCVELARVLGAFPAPPDNTSDATATADWSSRLGTWTKELSKLELKDQSLESRVKTFQTGWQNFATAMTTLIHISENTKKYDAFASTFNAQIDQTNQAISAANRFCSD